VPSVEHPTLADLGELRLIDEVILPLAKEFGLGNIDGDDCAYLETRDSLIAVTADVGPRPLLHALPGYEDDQEAAGWLAVVATASDVATAGATPFFLTNCVDAPPTLPVETLRAYLRGYFRACAELGFANGGGDVRHGPGISMRVFGAGQVAHGRRIGRGGAKPDDHLVLIGPAGMFMATYLLAESGDEEVVSNGRLLPEAERILRFPTPRLREMESLCRRRLIVAASDTSDGLLGAIDNICRASGCGFELRIDSTQLPRCVARAARLRGIDPWNIFFAWGDWSVAAVIRHGDMEAFRAACGEEAISWTLLGKANSDSGQLRAAVDEGPRQLLAVIRNENFISRGFNAGLGGHLRYLLETDMFGTAAD
jgi:thiamine-monophosphate kinase